MHTLLQDLRFGLRMLMKRPVVAIVAALSLAFGVAAHTSTFAVASGFLFEPLRWKDPERILLVNERLRQNPDGDSVEGIAPAALRRYREASTSLISLEGSTERRANLTGGGEPERIVVVEATPGLLDVFGRAPVLGRTLLSPDGDVRTDEVVLSHAFFERRLGGDPGSLGTTLQIDGRPHLVVGVMPHDFDFLPNNVDVYRSVDLRTAGNDWERSFLGYGRLKEGATPEQTQAELAVVSDDLSRQQPTTQGAYEVQARPVRDFFPGPTDTRLMAILMAVSGFVLIVACVNIANLLLARADERQKEVALRTALGAGKGRLLRQFLTESLTLALIGGVLGIVFSVAFIRFAAGSMPPELPLAFFPKLDAAVMAYGLAISTVAGIFFGIAPAIHGFAEPTLGLGESSRGGTATRGRQRLRNAFIVAQTAAALTLLTGAGVLGNVFDRLVNDNSGFEPEGLLSLELTASEDRFVDDAEVLAFQRDLLDRLAEIPQVESVAGMSSLPRARAVGATQFTIDGRPVERLEETPETLLQVISPSYFSTLRSTISRGREFDERDRSDAANVAIVSQAFADQWLGEGPALGSRITVDGRSREIVGIADDVLLTRMPGSINGGSAFLFLPLEQQPTRNLALVVRSDRDTAQLATGVRDAIRALDPDQPIAAMQPLQQFIEGQLSGPKVISQILGLFGAVALALSALGLYSVVAHSVSQRRREIGIRMALGAGRTQVLSWVGRQGLGLTALGFLIGLPMAAAMVIAIRSMFLDTQDFTGLGPLLTVIPTLAVVSLLASLLPARSATRVDPSRVLQED